MKRGIKLKNTIILKGITNEKLEEITYNAFRKVVERALNTKLNKEKGTVIDDLFQYIQENTLPVRNNIREKDYSIVYEKTMDDLQFEFKFGTPVAYQNIQFEYKETVSCELNGEENNKNHIFQTNLKKEPPVIKGYINEFLHGEYVSTLLEKIKMEAKSILSNITDEKSTQNHYFNEIEKELKHVTAPHLYEYYLSIIKEKNLHIKELRFKINS